MSITPDVVDLKTVTLSQATTKGMDAWAIEAMEESVTDINEHLGRAGASLRYVASNLHEIKLNIKPGNWKAFLDSGVLSCSPKYATDLVASHSKWLCKAEVDDSVIAQLSPRSLAAMANATEPERQRVYRLIANAGTKESITEAKVRAAIKGKRAPKRAKNLSADERLKKQKQINNDLLDQNKQLRAENAKLRRQLGEKLLEM